MIGSRGAFTAAVVAVAIAAGASTSVAQLPRVEITPYAGFRFGGGLKAGTVNQEQFPVDNLSFSSGLMLGTAVDIRLIPGLQLELFGERMSSRLESDLSGSPFPATDYDLWYLHAGVLWEVNKSYQYPIRPLVGITAGTTILDPDSDAKSVARFSVGILLGVKYFPSRDIGIRLHGRLLTTNLFPDDEFFCSEELQVCYRISERTYMTQIDLSLGVIIPIY